MRMHAIQTALIDVKRRYVDARGSNRLARLTSVLLDREFTSIPVYAWVVEHPEGLLVIDTGETARVQQPDFFPVLQRPYWQSQFRFHVTPETEIGAQMRQLNLAPEDVRWVVLTHTHFDHSDALYHFPNAEFILSRKEYHDICKYRSAHFGFPSKWPSWFQPRTITFEPTPVGTFSQSHRLTRAGDVWIVPTPGHTMGHQSVVVQNEGTSLFFAGDTSFDQDSLLKNRIDAPTFNAHAAAETRRRILDYARHTPLVYLTTHDFATGERLRQRTPLF
jgi:N-acyl homoserine lactone hydrolase